jgi:hypothetical protein
MFVGVKRGCMENPHPGGCDSNIRSADISYYIGTIFKLHHMYLNYLKKFWKQQKRVPTNIDI